MHVDIYRRREPGNRFSCYAITSVMHQVDASNQGAP